MKKMKTNMKFKAFGKAVAVALTLVSIASVVACGDDKDDPIDEYLEKADVVGVHKLEWEIIGNTDSYSITVQASAGDIYGDSSPIYNEAGKTTGGIARTSSARGYYYTSDKETGIVGLFIISPEALEWSGEELTIKVKCYINDKLTKSESYTTRNGWINVTINSLPSNILGSETSVTYPSYLNN